MNGPGKHGCAQTASPLPTSPARKQPATTTNEVWAPWFAGLRFSRPRRHPTWTGGFPRAHGPEEARLRRCQPPAQGPTAREEHGIAAVDLPPKGQQPGKTTASRLPTSHPRANSPGRARLRMNGFAAGPGGKSTPSPERLRRQAVNLCRLIGRIAAKSGFLVGLFRPIRGCLDGQAGAADGGDYGRRHVTSHRNRPRTHR